MSQDIRKIIANNIEKFRTKKSLTREELSIMLGFDNSYISKLERGTINITIDKLTKIADALDAKVKDLLS